MNGPPTRGSITTGRTSLPASGENEFEINEKIEWIQLTEGYKLIKVGNTKEFTMAKDITVSHSY